MSRDFDDKRTTEQIDTSLLDLDLRSSRDILALLLDSQEHALNAVRAATISIEAAVGAAAERLAGGGGRLILVGAGASGRLAVQDGAELWPTYGWPSERLALVMAGGNQALTDSVEGVEDDTAQAVSQVRSLQVGEHDVVLALAASGTSPWTCQWLQSAAAARALAIGVANNSGTPLLASAGYPILLESGHEVLAGSTRMAAGTAQKIFLNLFSTTLMIRLNRTYGNLMVDMAVRNRKLDGRKLRLLHAIHPARSVTELGAALESADGWVKLAALVAQGHAVSQARSLLAAHGGSLRRALDDESGA